MPPSDRVVTLDLIDLGGHRAMRMVRYLDDPDPSAWMGEGSTIGPNVLFEYEPAADDPDRWDRVWFTCKQCRDQGTPMESTALVSDLHSVGNALWDRANAVPKHGRFRLSSPVQ